MQNADPTALDARCRSRRCEDERTYQMAATCRNCSRRYVATLTRGHESRDLNAECPYCGSRVWSVEPIREPAPPGEVLLEKWTGLPPGLYEGANRYRTDDEEVLHLWREGRSWDLREPRYRERRTQVSISERLRAEMEAAGWKIAEDPDGNILVTPDVLKDAP